MICIATKWIHHHLEMRCYFGCTRSLRILMVSLLLGSWFYIVSFVNVYSHNCHFNLVYIHIILKVMKWKYMYSYQTLAQENWGFHNLFHCLYSLQYGASDGWGATDLGPWSGCPVIVDTTTISSIRGHLEWRCEISNSNNHFNFYVVFHF